MINTQRLVDLRELYGLSRKELANKLGVKEQTIWQYEKEIIEPSFQVLRGMTELFSVNSDYFFNSSNVPQVAIKDHLNYRTKNNQPTKSDNYELKYIDYVHYYIQYLNQFVTIRHHDLVNVQKQINREYHSLITYEEHMNHMDRFADIVRKELEIESNSKLMYILEKYGVYILEKKLPTEKDAYSIWVEDTPYIVLNKDLQSEARRTYSLAHELGHLLMHRDIDISVLVSSEYNKLEKEANEFAACLLLPLKDIKKDFISLPKPSNPNSYVRLKQKYHVSIAAIEYRCYKLGLLSANQNSYFYKLMNKNRYRIKEPLDDKWALTVPGKLLYMTKFVLNHGISKDSILGTNGIKGEFLDGLFGFREPIFSEHRSTQSPIEISY